MHVPQGHDGLVVPVLRPLETGIAGNALVIQPDPVIGLRQGGVIQIEIGQAAVGSHRQILRPEVDEPVREAVDPVRVNPAAEIGGAHGGLRVPCPDLLPVGQRHQLSPVPFRPDGLRLLHGLRLLLSLLRRYNRRARIRLFIAAPSGDQEQDQRRGRQHKPASSFHRLSSGPLGTSHISRCK